MDIYLAEKLRRMALEVRHLKEHAENLDKPGYPSFAARLKDVVLPEATALELHNTPQKINEVLQTLRTYATPSARRTFLEELETEIRLDLVTVKFVHIPERNLTYLERDIQPPKKEKWFGKEVINKFPGAYYDILEARNCMATGCWTACVFHLMRVVERALRVLSDSLDIDDITEDWERSWTNILKNIYAEKNSAIWLAEKDFYENMYAHFQSVKNPWRNATMHVTRDYDEAGAQEIFHAVSTLMRHLATKIGE